MRRILIVLAAIAVLFAGWKLWQRADRPDIATLAIAPDQAPAAIVAPLVPARLADFHREGEHRLGVLVTDPSADWLGLVRAFDAAGIPYDLTSDPQVAVRQSAVLVYPIISGKVLSHDALVLLADHARQGGTIIASNLAGGGLEPVFGIAAQTPSRARKFIRWSGDNGAAEDRLSYFSAAASEAKVGSWAVQPTTAQVLGRFDDGEAAVTCRDIGGKACFIGLDIGSLAMRAMNGRSAQVAGQYVNAYQPSLDVLIRFLRDRYVAADSDPYLVDTARRGTSGTLILTHDIDYTRSIDNAVQFAAVLRDKAVTGTFFVQTKYVKDWNDDSFFNAHGIAQVKHIAPGMEIGSHGVSHSRVFSTFDLCSGVEAYPDYLPFVESRNAARDGTVLGELRVSRYLLQQASGQPVRSFRPGHLSYPRQLPEALAATGYRYDSALTAPLAMSHLPFQLSYARGNAGLVPAFEFPVTIEDERPPPLAQRFDAAVAVIDKIAVHRGIAVLLNHPDVLDPKLGFEARLIDHYKPRLWITSLGQFGDWWLARSTLRLVRNGDRIALTSGQRIEGLDIVFPKRANKRVSLDGASGSRTIASPK